MTVVVASSAVDVAELAVVVAGSAVVMGEMVGLGARCSFLDLWGMWLVFPLFVCGVDGGGMHVLEFKEM